ncbi:MAG: cytochrome c oxidase subunit 3 [Myxococcales bacterium]|nr:cytochrome c oxidase subunit 3 [Myxococcales bacterium]MCB9579257.1 cytochrome c oxidase subunit 3 [Polyangiaceae bacterium]
MWLFLASEALLFGGLFTLYAAYRAHFPKAFAEAVRDNTTYLGSLNTVVLITSSFLVALAVHALRHRKPRRAIYLVLSTCFLAAVFLAIKFTEYSIHFQDGIYPGGQGAYFAHAALGTQIFFTLYFVSTGLHALHVTVGACVLGWCARRIGKERLSTHGLEAAAMYWHLVDVIWIFLWPLFYLMR